MAGFFGNLLGLFTGAPGVSAAKQSAAAATKYANIGAQAASKPIMQGEKQALGYEGASILPYQTIFGQGKPLVDEYSSALMGGQGATDAFNQYLGSTGALTEEQRGLEGLARIGTSTGQLGQTSMDAADYLTSDIQKNYQAWLSDLFQGANLEATGAAGQQRGQLAQAGTVTGASEDLSKIQGGRYATIGAAQSALPMNINAANMGGAGNTLNALFGIGELATLGGGLGVGGLMGSNLANQLIGGGNPAMGGDPGTGIYPSGLGVSSALPGF